MRYSLTCVGADQMAISLWTHTCLPRVTSRECLLMNRLSCIAAHAVSCFLTGLAGWGAGYRTLIANAALLTSALAALAARPARLVGRACFSMRSGPNRSGSCSAMASANFIRFLAIIVRSSCGYLRPFLPPGRGQGGRSTPPLSRHHVGNRACVAARPGKKTPPANPLALHGGLAGGVSGSSTAMRARFRAVQHEQQSQDMTGSACRFWRGLCVRAGSMLVLRLLKVPWSLAAAGLGCCPRRARAQRKPKAQAGPGEAGPRFITRTLWNRTRAEGANEAPRHLIQKKESPGDSCKSPGAVTRNQWRVRSAKDYRSRHLRRQASR